MSNPTMISFLAILVILATAVWRTVTGRATNGYRTIWAAGLFAIGLSFFTDLSAPTGAAISAAILVFFIINTLKQKPGSWTPPSPNGSTGSTSVSTSGGSTSSGGSGNTKATPPRIGPPTALA